MHHKPACNISFQRDFLSSFGASLPTWTMPLCGITGAALFLAGTVCFVAYNWNILGILGKFALPLGGLVLFAWGAYIKGLHTGTGKTLSFAYGLFIGLFWAVYGQVFQTGSFVYEFCLVWAVSLLPIAWLAGNRWLWLLWAAVCNLYILSFGDVLLFYTIGIWVLFLFNAACFAASEWTLRRSGKGEWFSLFFLAGALCAGLANGIGGWHISFWLSAGAMCLLIFYAWHFKRGAVQLGFCAIALDFLLSERIVFALSDKNNFMAVLAVLAVFVVSAYGVYLGSRRENENDC